jgi:hypothetical protein
LRARTKERNLPAEVAGEYVSSVIVNSPAESSGGLFADYCQTTPPGLPIFKGTFAFIGRCAQRRTPNAELHPTTAQLGAADRLDNAPFLKEFLGAGR